MSPKHRFFMYSVYVPMCFIVPFCLMLRQMFDHHRARVSVSSPILPARVLEYNMDTKSMVC